MQIDKIVTGACGTNTYIIIRDQKAIVVDPGAEPHKINEFLSNRNAKLKYILITHAHFDHVGAVAELQNDGVTVYMSKTDYELCDDICSVGEDIYVQPFKVDVLLENGDEFVLSDIRFKVMHTPGHTPGSICYIADDEYIFTGDTLFRLSIGRTDFIGGSKAQLLASVKKLFALDHDYELLPGHMNATTLYFERDNNPYVD